MLGGLFSILIVASLIGFVLSRRKQNTTISYLNARIRAWWVMCTIAVIAMLIGPIGSVVLFFWTDSVCRRLSAIAA